MAKDCFIPLFLTATALAVCFVAGCQAPQVKPLPVQAPVVHHTELVNARQHTSFEVGESLEPCISPDGKKLLFASNHHGPTFDIFLKDVSGKATTQLTTNPCDDRQPALSPNGKMIAFVSNREGNWDIYVKASEPGSPDVRLTADESDEVHPSWSSDGTRLVFSRRNPKRNTWEIRIITFGKKGPSISSPGVEGLFPEWSPVKGSETILFQRPRGRNPELYTLWTVQSNGKRLTEVLESTQWATVTPAWSTDGKWIVFSAVGRTGAGSLWIVRADGKRLTRVSNGADPQWEAACSRDGRIFFTISRGGVKNIWSITPDYNDILPESGPSKDTPAAGTRPTATGSGKQT